MVSIHIHGKRGVDTYGEARLTTSWGAAWATEIRPKAKAAETRALKETILEGEMEGV